jgi:hypothetical protein
MKFAVVASLAATAVAMAPAKKAVKPSFKVSPWENALGAQDPLGYYDPIGILTEADEKTFNLYRSAEIKHGRIAQLAFVGNIIPRAGIYLPGNIDLEGHSFDSYPPGLAAVFGDEAIPFKGTVQILMTIFLLELFVMKDVTGTSEFPGDIRNGFDFGWDKFDEETKLRKRAIELNNGRAAMMGILGLMVHELIPGNPVIGVFFEY